MSWLSTQERAHYDSLRTQRLRHDYLAARALCRATLSRYTGVAPSAWTFGTGASGKPKVVRPAEFKSLRFNLAHTDGLAICLVSRAGAVGVDAEFASRKVNVPQMARHFLPAREQEILKNLPARQRKARFFDQWVLREAYFKGIGKGIATAPERFTIRIGENGEPLPVGSWQLFLHRPSPNHVAAVAVRGQRGEGKVSVRWLKANDRLFLRRP